LRRTTGYKTCLAEGSGVGILIREARIMMASFLISVALAAIFIAAAGIGQSAASEIVHIGSSPRPIYRIASPGDGAVDIDELIDRVQMSSANGADDPKPSAEPSDSSAYFEASPSDPLSESAAPGPSEATSEEDAPPDPSQTAELQIEDYEPPYVRVPIVSDPSGAEVYIDGAFYGITPFIATVEPESHLVEAYLEGYWNWFNVVEFSSSGGTMPISLTPKEPASASTNVSNGPQNVTVLVVAPPSMEENGTANLGPPPSAEGDFLEANYRKLLIFVALLTFLIGSGSIATWARSRLTTSIRIRFPRDGEDRWAGLIEGQASGLRGRKRQVYVLVRYDDEHLEVRRRVLPNRDGRWSTRCDVEEGTVYRIYAVVVDRPLLEGSYLEEIPSHRAISEVGPVTGKEKPPRSGDG